MLTAHVLYCLYICYILYCIWPICFQNKCGTCWSIALRSSLTMKLAWAIEEASSSSSGREIQETGLLAKNKNLKQKVQDILY